MKYFLVTIIAIIIISIPIYGKGIIYTLNSDSIDGFLVYPEQIKEGPDGLIYVADFKDYYIKIFSPGGKFLKKIIGRGEGPGQAKRLGAFGFSYDKKSIFIVEYFNGHNWITFTDLNGNYQSLIKLDVKERYGTYDAFMLPDSRFILEIHKYNFDSTKGNSNYFEYYFCRKLQLISKNGLVEKEFLAKNYINSISMSPNCCDIEVPFQPVYLWLILDDKLIFTDGLSTDLQVVDIKNGRTGFRITRLPKPEMVTNDDMDKWRNNIKNSLAYKNQRGAFAVSKKVIDLYKESVFSMKPNLKGISLTSKGNILVERPANPDNFVNYLLLDKKFKIIGNINIKAIGLTITGNYLLFKVLDADEEAKICFVKKTSIDEKDDFDNLQSLFSTSK